MKIALIGYGAMGKIVERLAVERGHEIAGVLGSGELGLSEQEIAAVLSGSDAAIDFTVAEAVRRNVEAAVIAKVPIVVGTTGWNEQRQEIENVVKSGNGAMVFGANFSIGMNLFYKIADFAAELFAKFPEYESFVEEQHHSRKKDAPSGTALKLKDVVSKHVDVGDIAATRAGNIPGTHRVGFDGPADQILLEHSARSREGFAAGAILAAEWIVGKTGVFDFSEIVSEVVEVREINHR
ncbi:MAG TPA: dihydrodipicolinate reductase C-terminal domain-containing protein [Pyrinomonadaceae bacterium]|nr:dihydrodipicolinate reductase C-terminal domain-containing protein [Pyrinomonadaceae bacterium]